MRFFFLSACGNEAICHRLGSDRIYTDARNNFNVLSNNSDVSVQNKRCLRVRRKRLFKRGTKVIKSCFFPHINDFGVE